MAGRMFGHRDLQWRGNALHLGQRKLAEVIPDAKWAGMWRVRLPGGHLTDMVNISRARDAARSLALADLNCGAQETPSGAGYSAFAEGAAQ
jgi:hypothetical protein